jgi:hypothetical protein
MNKRIADYNRLVLLAFTIGCARPHAETAPTTAVNRFAILSQTAALQRAQQDSVVADINRLSRNSTTTAQAGLTVLRKRAASIDSAYRRTFADLWSMANASISGTVPPASSFDVDMAPAPFVRAFADGSHWMLQSPLIQELGKDGAYVIIVPRGFVTDFASVPQPLQVLRGVRTVADRYANAALVHDYLYWIQDCTREQSDRIMELALKEAGISFLERKLIYEGLRQFGQSAWDAHRKERQAGLLKTVGAPYDQVPPTGTWAEYREWLRSVRAGSGAEYHVSKDLCAMADSSSSDS